MPIRPELRPLYKSDEFRKARSQVMERARNSCEICRKPHRQAILVIRDGSGMWWEECIGDSLLALFPLGPRVVDYTDPDWLLEFAPVTRWGGTSCAYRGWASPEGRKLFIKNFEFLVPPSFVRNNLIGVAHLDHNPKNNQLDNLKAFCASCHFRHDAGQHRHNVRRTQAERNGQLWIAPALEERI
jgi:hypothetical protein